MAESDKAVPLFLAPFFGTSRSTACSLPQGALPLEAAPVHRIRLRHEGANHSRSHAPAPITARAADAMQAQSLTGAHCRSHVPFARRRARIAACDAPARRSPPVALPQPPLPTAFAFPHKPLVNDIAMPASNAPPPPTHERVVHALLTAINSAPQQSPLAPALRSILNPLTHLSHITRFAQHQHSTEMRCIVDFAEDVHALLRNHSDRQEFQKRLTELYASALSLQRELDARGFTTAFEPSHMAAARISNVMECLNESPRHNASLSDVKRVLLSLPALYETLDYLVKLPLSISSLGIALRSAIDATAILSAAPRANQTYTSPTTQRLETILDNVQTYKDRLDDCSLPESEKDIIRDCLQTIMETNKLTADRIRITIFPKQSFSLPHEIGRSPHTTVYKATFSMRHGPAPLWTTTVALKALHLSLCSRLRYLYFVQESLRLQSLSHPCLPTFYGASWPFTVKGSHTKIHHVLDMPTAPVALIATELMTHDLHQARQEACLRSLSTRLKILRDVANAICYLHSGKVYHGRVIPQNVLVRIHGNCIYGNAKLDVTTFLSRAVLSTQQKTRCTKNLLFFSPEHLSHGHQYYTGDIWSFGMVACYLLIDGPHLLHNPSEEAILRIIVNKTLVDNAKKWCACICDARLREIVSRCLLEDPVSRIDSQTLFDLIQAAVDRLPDEPEKVVLNQSPYEDVDDVVLDSSGDPTNPIIIDAEDDSDEVTFIGKKRARESSFNSPPRRPRPRLVIDDDESGEENRPKFSHPPAQRSNPVLVKEAKNCFEKGSTEFNQAMGVLNDTQGDLSQAYQLFKKAAESEFVEAYRYCGQYLLNGWGTKQNHEEAVKYLRKAAAWNDSEGIRLLGVCHEEGHGVPVNVTEAIRLYKKAANLGEATANTNIAICYDKGVGVRKNRRAAISYYKKAAAEDDEVALNNLGVLYNQGSKRDFALAVYYFREAIKYGSLEAQCNLGDCYMYGQGVPKDIWKAMELYSESSEKGNLVARTEMATLFYLGLGVPVDYVKAVSMYREASSIPEALRWLGIAHYDGNGVDENIDEAVRLFRQAIDMGSHEANLNLGLCYFQGKGVPQSYEQALEHYKVAAENDSKEASLWVGNMYFEGLGVQKDLHVAYKWYKEGQEVDLTYLYVTDKLNV
eukprot:TRINITY_DN12229_c0_g1_i1.p1 TRINITY_DN12229_c0_g1~~TRINITY_DN12229_c0_g1_i1.p1  ORF type:complete len:1143 (+),score=161.05 TRINITY_DN12229_c0_g1_i1:475-3903(+)